MIPVKADPSLAKPEEKRLPASLVLVCVECKRRDVRVPLKFLLLDGGLTGFLWACGRWVTTVVSRVHDEIVLAPLCDGCARRVFPGATYEEATRVLKANEAAFEKLREEKS